LSISNIVIGIVIAYFIIRGLERLADFLGRNNDEPDTNPNPLSERLSPESRAPEHERDGEVVQ